MTTPRHRAKQRPAPACPASPGRGGAGPGARGCITRRQLAGAAWGGGVLWLLGGCGVDVAGVGGEGTGKIAQGRIDGFGSLILGGRRWDDSAGSMQLELNPAAPQAVTADVLRLGMVARLRADGERIEQLTLVPEVLGPVQQVDAAARRITVAGQAVQIDSVPADPTALGGFDTIAGLAIGDRVLVYGQRDASGLLRASRIERTVLDGVRVAGPWAAAGGTGGRIGTLTIDDTSAVRLPAGALPTEGERVVAWGPALADGALRATVLAIDDPAERAASAAEAELAGVLTALHGASRFRVHGIEVDAASAVFTGGTPADLREGRWVQVQGLVDVALVRAERVTLVDDSVPPTAELTAAVAGVDALRRFTVRGTPVDADAADFTNLSPTNIASGVRVSVRGRVAGARVAADTVATDSGAIGQTLVQAGTVIRRDGSQFRLVGLSQPFRIAPDTVYEGGRRGELRDGVPAQLTGRLEGTEFVVAQVRFGGTDALVELFGVVGNLEDAGGGSGEFEIDLQDVAWAPDTLFLGPTGSPADLADGRIARTVGRRDGGVVRAVEVDARATQPGIVRLRAEVEAYRSATDFRLRGQRIDASGAVFDPPDLAAQLRNGTLVDVEGRFIDGVLRASRVGDP